MNILHHKSWHVYNKDNIARVKRDEAEAEAEAKKKQERVQLAESEARLQLLRNKANSRLQIDKAEQDQPVRKESTERFNLFEDLEKQNINANNEENEAEQKEKDKQWDRKITMYLDKGSTKEEEPWYAKTDRKEEKYKDQYVFKSKRKSEHKRKRTSEAVNEDPLNFITKTLKKSEEKRRKKEHGSRSHHSSRGRDGRNEDKYSKRESSSSKKTPSIEELRAKRLERERVEKAKVKSLYMDTTDDNDVELDDRRRGYNFQYNRDDTIKAKEHGSKRKIRFSD